MKVFTIDADHNITVHPSGQAAQETCPFAFSTEAQFADLIGPDSKRLVDIWNSLPGVKPVTKFTSRKVATERIWKAIQSFGETVPAAVPREPENVPRPNVLVTPPATERKPEVAMPAEKQIVEPEAVNVSAEPAAVISKSTAGAAHAKKGSQPKPTGAKKEREIAPDPSGPREGSKKAQVLALMSAPGGVSLAELMAVTGWQKHSVRGFISGALVKKGIAVESFQREDGQRAYRVNA